jgi:hypothetical protein
MPPKWRRDGALGAIREACDFSCLPILEGSQGGVWEMAKFIARCRFLPIVEIILVSTTLCVPVRAAISQTILSIQASNASGSASLAINYADGVWDPVNQRYGWQLPSAVPLIAGGNTIATVNSASLTINFLPSPSINLAFGVNAGLSDTTFLLDSAVVSFNTIPAASAAGAFLAGCTVGDSGAGNGMWLYEPGLAGFGAFQAYTDTNPAPADLFSNLLALVGSYGGGTATASESQPSSGYNPICADIHDMMVRTNFVLTNRDSAQGNATFALVPEPAAALLMLVGAIVGNRLRRL